MQPDQRSPSHLVHRIANAVETANPVFLGLLTFVVLSVVYLATGNVDGYTQSPDPVAAGLPAWTWSLHHTLYLDHVNYPNVWVYRPMDHFVSNRTPGIVFFAIPFYVLFGRDAIFSAFPATLAAAVASAGAVALLVAALRRIVSPRFAFASGLVFAFGTATWSVAADVLFPHGPDMLMLAAALYFLATKRNLLAALAIALCVPIRAHVAVVALVAGVWFAVRRRSLWPLLTFGVPSTITLGLLSLYNHWMFGTWAIQGGYPYVNRHLAKLTDLGGNESLPLNLLGSMVSPDRGLLIWCPLVILLFVNIRRAWRAAPDWVRIGAISALLYLLVQMKLNYFSGGDRFWSYRLTLEPLLLTAPLLVLAAREMRTRHRALQGLTIAAMIYGVGTQAIGAIFYTPEDFFKHSPWTYSHLAARLEVGGAGPDIVMGLTVVLMVAAMVWRLRATPEQHPEDMAAAPA